VQGFKLRRIGSLALFCAAGTAGLHAAPAHGSTATADRATGALSVTAAIGETNVITVRADDNAGRIQVTDQQGITPGPGCRREELDAETTVECEIGEENPAITVTTNDLSDTVTLDPTLGVAYTALLEAGAGQDFLTGGPGSDTLKGDADCDAINGEGGADVVFGGGDDDARIDDDREPGFRVPDCEGGLRGGGGADTIRGEGGNDLLAGGSEADLLYGGADAELTASATGGDCGCPIFLREAGLFGGPGADELYGGHDVDALSGEEGDDWMDGGSFGDRFQGGDGSDTVDYSSRTAGVHADTDTFFTPDDGEAGEGDSIFGDVENFVGGAGPDTLTGDGSANSLVGNAGTDTLNARGGGADTLNCGLDTDTGTADGMDTLFACEFPADTDADGVPEPNDACPTGAATGVDRDGDGCKDEAEDPDDDADGVNDASDACPAGALSGADTDADGCRDSEDNDDDADGIGDQADQCDTAGGVAPSGCPLDERDLTLKYSSEKRRFKGQLGAARPACRAGEEVTIHKETSTGTTVVGTATTSPSGTYAAAKRASRGKYFATVSEHVEPDVAACQPAASPTIRVR
jgi:hypothetical protein